MSLNLDVGNDECIILVIFIGCIMSGIKVMGVGWGGGGAHQTRDARKALSK